MAKRQIPIASHLPLGTAQPWQAAPRVRASELCSVASPGRWGRGSPCLRRSAELPPPPAGHEECERALVDFVAFQDIALRRLLRLQQALAGPGAWRPASPTEGRAALQQQLWRQLTTLREARPGALAAGLLRALHVARLPGLERTVRTHFFTVP